ncbi:MAG: HTTM domain-containing protein [Pseudomonadales bacterium]
MDSSALKSALFRQVDSSSLVAFRVAFGAIMLWEVKRYLVLGRVARYWIEPSFHFTYPFFGWVHPWSGDGMYLHFYVLGVLAAFIAFGFLYRLSAFLFFLAFSYVFLLEEAQYLNHFYLIVLISFLMIWVPAHRSMSIDARLRPRLRSETVPAWAVALLAGQIGVVYLLGGIAKIGPDWLRGEPMRAWLAARDDFPLIGAFFTTEWMVYLMSYGGMLIDLAALPLLVMRRTRAFMFGALVLFHLMNAGLFSIGIFPWFMIAATTLFFRPDWPRRLLEDLWIDPNRRGSIAWLGAVVCAVLAVWLNEALELIPALIGAIAGALLFWQVAQPSERQRGFSLRALGWTGMGITEKRVMVLLTIWFAVQVTVPLRHFFIPGYVSWTEEGHKFAWHMKLRDKDATTRFIVYDGADGRSWEIDAENILTRRQYTKMSARPYMIHRFARFLAETLAANGYPKAEVRVDAMASLNGRAYQRLVDPKVDLGHTPVSIRHAAWIVPLTEPLKD